MNYTYKQVRFINFSVMVSISMEQLINITGAVSLGHVGEIELGASATVGIYYLAIYMFGFGFSIGLQVMVARRNGEQDYKETGKTFFQGLFFLLGLAISPYPPIHMVSPLIPKKLIVSSDIYRAVILYLDRRNFGPLFLFPLLVIRFFSVGVTHIKALSWAAAIAILISIPLNFCLTFTRELGILGAATVSSLVEMGSFMMLSFYTWMRLDKEKYGSRPAYNDNLLIKVLKLSTWSMLHALISVAPWFLFFASIEHLGKIELTTSNITRSVSAIFLVIANSFALTTGSLVSNAIGAGEGKTLPSAYSKILKLGHTIGFPLVTIALLCNRWIIGFYTSNELLIQLAFAPFVVMLLNYTFTLPGCVYLNAVGGTGKTQTTLLFQVTTTAVYLVYLYRLCRYTQAPLVVYLIAEYVFVILLVIQSIFYLKKRHY